ncbi:IS5 family transposase ISOt6 [Orientia tsutsugamushi]|uniref:IS5 family transposase ISOt6 n=1 Tax=Orientia tsutsugamushi TaxID=784 RepID=A0A2R8F4Y9_ORITS|nr:IS5 family transposase ISOt6 [Orientia tsutsugamushi]
MADFFREIDKKVMQVTCTDFSNGKEHNFRLFKEYKI